MPNYLLPDGKALDFEQPATGRQLAERISMGLARKAIAVKIGDEIRDLDRLLPAGAQVRIITASNDDKDALSVLRHSAAHVLAEAVCSLWPKTRLAYGPAIDDGFFYDMQIRNAADEAVTLTDGEFAAIEAKMQEIIKANRRFVRCEYSTADGLARTASDKYKHDNAERAIARRSRSTRPASPARRGKTCALVRTSPRRAFWRPAKSCRWPERIGMAIRPAIS